jgi:hypothetical protein
MGFHKAYLQSFIVALALAGATLNTGTAMANTEEPEFTLVLKEEAFELRDYAPMIAAEVSVDGDRDSAVSAGFRILAGYIFGGNAGSAKIDMTAPVTQSKGETIAMTAPVTQTGAAGVWAIRFMMPKAYTIASLPKPNDARIRFVEIPGRRVAVLRFSGLWSDSNLMSHREELAALLKAKKLKPQGEPSFAFYDPPWQPFFWRRNEIMWEVSRH